MADAPNTPPEAKKIELLSLMSDAEAQARQLESLGQEVVRYARLAADTAPPLRAIYEAVPCHGLDPSQWDTQLGNWRAVQAAMSGLGGALATAGTFHAVINTAISVSASGVFSPSPFTGAPPIAENDPVVAVPRATLFRTIERFPSCEDAKRSMIRLGLTTRGGNSRPPSDLLEEAWGAMATPVVPGGRPTSVLLPLRECLDATVTELLRRQVGQGRAQGWKGKVVSLGQHCARPGLGADHFDRLSGETDRLMNQLSGSKQADHSRERVIEMFYQAVLHLNALMDSIDEGKLRPA